MMQLKKKDLIKIGRDIKSVSQKRAVIGSFQCSRGIGGCSTNKKNGQSGEKLRIALFAFCIYKCPACRIYVVIAFKMLF